MEWFESILYGFASGLTEFLPVSSQAHQALLLKLFGGSSGPLLELLLHAGMLLGLYSCLRQQLQRIAREDRLARVPARRRKRQPDMQCVLDLRLVKTAFWPVLLSFAAYFALSAWRTDLSKTALLLALNGLILYVPMHSPTGNKDSRSMSQLDGVLLGLAGALGILPGVSRVGAVVSTAMLRGADKENAVNWALLLSIAGLVCAVGFDLYDLFLLGAGTLSFPVLIQYILAAAAAFGGAVIGVRSLQFLAVRAGFSSLAYYSWGAALFSFILYLTV